MTGKGQEETFWDDCNILNFVKGLSYTGVCINKNSANLYLNLCTSLHVSVHNNLKLNIKLFNHMHIEILGESILMCNLF